MGLSGLRQQEENSQIAEVLKESEKYTFSSVFGPGHGKSNTIGTVGRLKYLSWVQILFVLILLALFAYLLLKLFLIDMLISLFCDYVVMHFGSLTLLGERQAEK